MKGGKCNMKKNSKSNLYYLAQTSYNDNVRTGVRKYLVKSIIYYIQYKKLGGSKKIDRLEEYIKEVK
jgi:hypothetical protein